MRTNNVDETSPADDARVDRTYPDEPQELGLSLEDAIARARKLASEYESGHVVVRYATSYATNGFEGEFGPPPKASAKNPRRQGGRRRAKAPSRANEGTGNAR